MLSIKINPQVILSDFYKSKNFSNVSRQITFMLSMFMFLMTMNNCQKQNNFIVQDNGDTVIFKDEINEGVVSGKVIDNKSLDPIEKVKVIAMTGGEVLRAYSNSEGDFQLSLPETRRGQGFNIHFQKDGYQNATRGVVFELANHSVQINDVSLISINSNDDKEKK